MIERKDGHWFKYDGTPMTPREYADELSSRCGYGGGISSVCKMPAILKLVTPNDGFVSSSNCHKHAAEILLDLRRAGLHGWELRSRAHIDGKRMDARIAANAAQ